MIKRKTAAEFLAEMAADKNYLEMQQAKDAELKKRQEELAEAEAPLVEALNQVGLDVGSVWDLVNTTAPYPIAVPILFDHLRYAYPERIREGIVRALAVPEARSGWRVLRKLFETEPDMPTGGVKWAAGCALSAAADDSVIEEIIGLVKDSRYGFSRAALLDALKRSKGAKAKMTLNELRDDPVIGKEIKKSRRMDRLQANKKPAQ